MYIGRTGVKRDTKQRHRSDEKYEKCKKDDRKHVFQVQFFKSSPSKW